MPESERGLSRRRFLKYAGIGSLSAILSIPLIGAVSELSEEITGIPADHSGDFKKAMEKCQNSSDPNCLENYVPPPTTSNILYRNVQAPIQEELIFRVLPSTILSRSEGESWKENLDAHINGNVEGEFTRRELFAGITTSIAFGLGHNVVRSVPLKDVLPVPAASAGFVLWYLQRKGGIAASTSAHLTYNGTALFVDSFLK